MTIQQDTPGSQITCKYCGFAHVSRCGTYKGTQRYYCKYCKRKFKIDDSPFHMMKSGDYISHALHLFYEGSGINYIQRYLEREFAYHPSWSVVDHWIQKYTGKAIGIFTDAHPQTGDMWIAGETKLTLDGTHFRIYEIMDIKTKFILNALVDGGDEWYPSRPLVRGAINKACRTPDLLMTCIHNIKGIEKILDSNTELIPVYPKRPEINVEDVNDFQYFLYNTRPLFNRFKSLKRMSDFLEGWTVHYNYLRHQDTLLGATPADKAGIKTRVKSWAELVDLQV